MKAQIGKYKFGRHRNNWGIWQYDSVTESGASARFIKDVFSYEDAVREIYRLNGWGEPKSIKRVYLCNKFSYIYDNDSSNDKPRYVPCSGYLAESSK